MSFGALQRRRRSGGESERAKKHESGGGAGTTTGKKDRARKEERGGTYLYSLSNGIGLHVLAEIDVENVLGTWPLVGFEPDEEAHHSILALSFVSQTQFLFIESVRGLQRCIAWHARVCRCELCGEGERDGSALTGKRAVA